MIAKLAGYARSLFHIRSVRSYKPFRLHGRMTVIREHGELTIGDRTQLYPDVKISIIGTAAAPAVVRIGRRSTIGDRTQIHACRLVEIGDMVRISWDATLLENNYHSHSKGPIRIEDYAWLGCHVIVLSGVTIGRGAVIAAGSVVTKDVPPNAVAAGNPARVVRVLTPELRAESGMDALPGD